MHCKNSRWSSSDKAVGEAYSKPTQTLKTELFVKIANEFKADN